jgi:hypothetical protein
LTRVSPLLGVSTSSPGTGVNFSRGSGPTHRQPIQ